MKQAFAAGGAPYDVVRLRGNILEAMDGRGVTQRWLSEASGVSVEAIRRSLIVNNTDPQLSTIVRVARVLGVSVAQLIEGIDG